MTDMQALINECANRVLKFFNSNPNGQFYKNARIHKESDGSFQITLDVTSRFKDARKEDSSIPDVDSAYLTLIFKKKMYLMNRRKVSMYDIGYSMRDYPFSSSSSKKIVRGWMKKCVLSDGNGNTLIYEGTEYERIGKYDGLYVRVKIPCKLEIVKHSNNSSNNNNNNSSNQQNANSKYLIAGVGILALILIIVYLKRR